MIDESAEIAPTDQDAGALPRGNSAVEIAARRGFGPLAPEADAVWHGDSIPCASCGQLVRRAAAKCDSCGEDLSAEMLQKMRAFAGPWYVLEHVRPFPGVTAERLIRQIRRGVLTATTIVRGPTTNHQWRYAAETPGLCKYLGICLECQQRVTVDDSQCPSCGVDLGELSDGEAAADGRTEQATATGSESDEMAALSAAIETMPRTAEYVDDVPRMGAIRASWIAAGVLFVLVGVLFVVIQAREPSPASVGGSETKAAAPALPIPSTASADGEPTTPAD